jgi:hypothetical protein
MNLAGDLRIENSVSDKNGEAMRRKFSCFYESLDKRGLTLSAAAGSNGQAESGVAGFSGQAGPAGKYVQKNSSNYIELRPDGSLALNQNGVIAGGSYKIQGDTITLQVSVGKQTVTSSFRLSSDKMVGLKNGSVWERQGEPPSVRVSSETPGNDSAQVAGRYNQKDKRENYIDLNRDGTLSLHQDGKNDIGTFAVKGDVIAVTLNGQMGLGRLVGNTVVDPTGTVWERASERQKEAGAKLTIDEVLQMVTAKLSDDIIIAAIENSASRPEVTPADLIRLKTAGATDAVLRAVMKK